MKILVLAVHFEVSGARYIADAFARLGHDVIHSGPQASLEDAWGVDIGTGYEWEPNILPEITLSGVPVIGWNPDLIVIADTLTPDYAIPKAFRDVPAVVWSNDNHVRNSRQMNSEGLIKHYFLAHAHGPAQPVMQSDETWLPCAFDPTVFTPSAIPWTERSWDVAILGVMYPRRRAIVNKMRAAGLKVYAGTGLVYEEYAKVYQNARISLCVSAAGDVAQRVFETAAMGCTILTDPLLDLADVANGQSETNRKLGLAGFFVYHNDDEAVSIARDLVTTESAMAQFGALTLQKTVRERHTWDQRAQVVVDWYNTNYGGSVQKIDKVVTTIEMDEFGKNTGKTVEHLTTSTGAISNGSFKGDFPHRPIGISPVVDEIRMTATGENTMQVSTSFREPKPYLNLGCGTTHFPSAKPAGHDLIPDDIYSYPLWVNVDKVNGVGADKVFDLFTYPWPLEDNSFDGAVLAHIVEHIPHEIKTTNVYHLLREDDALLIRMRELQSLQDGWYAFFSELYRVLTPGALVHIVSPYGFSDGGITDPSHTRYLTMNTFTHSMTPEVSDGSTFKYNNGGINFVIDGNPQYRITPYGKLLQERTGFTYDLLMGTNLNICYDFYLTLKAVK